MYLSNEDLMKILLSILAGGAIGLEREFHDKAAGFRTLIFICAGASLFTIFSIRIGNGDPGRIAAALVTGVGFLGAGAIMKEGSRVIGLTTAATIWYIAALGMGFGAGEFGLSLLMTGIGLVVLWIFPSLEHRIGNIREEREYELEFPLRSEKAAALDALFREHRLFIVGKKQQKSGKNLTCTWRTIGSPADQDSVLQTLLKDRGIRSIRY
ncbi:MAG: MgtC/SapB family protein [Anaerolineales bacterium]|nr:MgtC/SapB family protein [Anaerolineales bacterium]